MGYAIQPFTELAFYALFTDFSLYVST